MIDVLPYLFVGHLPYHLLLLLRGKGHEIEVVHWILREERIGSNHRLRVIVNGIHLIVLIGEEVIVGFVLVEHGVLVVLVEGSLLIICIEDSCLRGLGEGVVLIILVEVCRLLVILCERSGVVIVVLIVAKDVIAGVCVIEHTSPLPHCVVIVVLLSEDASIGVGVVVLSKNIIAGITRCGIVCIW